jgi:phosphoribosylanthranilate isomerase
MTKIKICGVTTVTDALLCLEAGADYLGLVLSASPRRISIEAVMGIATYLGGRIPLVGVFARPEDLIAYDRLDGAPLDYYQIYFDIPDDITIAPRQGWIHARFIDEKIPPVAAGNNSFRLYDFKETGIARMTTLVDSPSRLGADVFLAGQLDATRVGAVVSRCRPYGVDVARGTEREPGRKDPQKVIDFINEVRHADA